MSKKSKQFKNVDNPKKKIDVEMEEEEKEEDLDMLINKNTRYIRVRVLIKWKQWFFYKNDKEQFKADLKNVIMNKKLVSIPDRSRLSSKLDGIIESYITIEIREPDLLEEHETPKGNYLVEICYNILERKLGELLTSSVKSIIMAQNEK